MQNTDQNDSPPSLTPETPSETQPQTPAENQPPSDEVNESTNEAMVGAMGESINGSDEPFVDAAEEAKFVEVNGGSSGQLHTPEEAAEERGTALKAVRDRVEIALRKFGKVTKQSHIVDRLLGCLTATASMPDRLPFTPVASLHLGSQNRDDHILHLAALVIESWGMFVRYGEDGLGDISELRSSVTLLEDIVQDRRLFKVYPVDPRSSLFTLRRITDQVKLNEAAEAMQAERDERIGDFPSQ